MKIKSITAIGTTLRGHGVRVRLDNGDERIIYGESTKFDLHQAETLAAALRKDVSRHGLSVLGVEPNMNMRNWKIPS